MAPGRQGFNLHDLIFPRAHAEAAAICPQQLAEIGARYGANVLRGAALGATSAAAFLTTLLYPSGTFGELSIVQIEGTDGAAIEIRHQPGEASAVMTATDAGGNDIAFDMVRTSDGYVVVGGYQRDGLGGLIPLSARQAIDIAGALFGEGNEGFTEHRNDGITFITTAADQLPLIFVTPEVRQEGFVLSTPANPQRPLDLITTAPDVGWVTTWMSQSNQENWTPITNGPARQQIPENFSTFQTPSGEIVHISPAGLVYGPDSAFGTRAQHVLAHTKANPGKPNHTVFDTRSPGEALSLVDEAWKNRSGSGVFQSNGRRRWTVDLGRPIGTRGETAVTIVVTDGTPDIITAFPK